MKNKIIKFIRGLNVILCFALFGIGALFVRYFIYTIINLRVKNNRKIFYSNTINKLWYFFIKLLEYLKIIKLNIEDINKLKSIRNSIILSTHPSFIDIVILMGKLAHNIFFKGIVNLLFIREGEYDWLEKSLQVLDSGFNIIIFPMGTRHKKNEYPRIRRGASLIANKSGCKLAFIKIETSTNFLQINQPIYDAGTEPVEYNIRYIGEINTTEYLKKYSDEVTFKTELTKTIADNLYKNKK